MIHSERDAHGVLTLTWDMPERSQNVFNEDSLSEFQAALSAAAADESVPGIIVASAKKAFIAGADLDQRGGGDILSDAQAGHMKLIGVEPIPKQLWKPLLRG